MAVVSKDIAAERSSSSSPRRLSVNLPDLMLGLVGFAIGTVLWVFGARYTVDGVLTIVNVVLGHLTVPARLFVPPPWSLYLILAPFPVAFSFIEWRRAPWDLESDRGCVALLASTLVWAIVFGLDAVTTWSGMGVIDPAAPTIMRQVAASAALRGMLTAFLTVVPELLMRSMFSVAKRAIRWR